MEYNRMVAYIYTYVDGIKGENAGFARIEIRNNRIKFRINMKNEHEELEVYLFYEEGNEQKLIWLGKEIFDGENTEFLYEGNGQDIEGFGIGFEEIKGIYISGSKSPSEFYGSEWGEKGIDVNRMNLPKVVKIQEVTEEKVWEDTIFDRENLYLFADDDFVDLVEIAPDDIEKLPNTNWHLMSNSFVKYGYSTFRHLIMGRINEPGKMRYFIGVPGVYNRRERVNAEMYGFSHFKFSMRSDVMLSRFGYWYREVTP